MEETFYQNEFVYSWLHSLANLVREVSLESLRLKVHEYSCWPSADPRSKAKWQSHDVSKINNSVLEDLANLGSAQAETFFSGPNNILGHMGFFALSDHHHNSPIHNVPGARGAERKKDEGADSPRPPPSSLRKLWLSAPSQGPTITSGMAALGMGMPKLEELVVDRLNITNEGWERFASRIAATTATAVEDYPASASANGDKQKMALTPTLRSIKMNVACPRFLPSAAARRLLEDVVSEGVTVYVNTRRPAFVATGGKASTPVTSSAGGPGSGRVSGQEAERGRAGAGPASGPCGTAAAPCVVLDCEGRVVEVDVSNGGPRPWMVDMDGKVNARSMLQKSPSKQVGADAIPSKTRVMFKPWLTSGLNAGDL